MSEELKLLPCPFCGGKAQARPPGFSNKHVTCVDCHSHALSVTMWNHRDTTSVQQEREECAKVLDGFEQEFLSRAEESIQRNNPASARFEKSRALELKSYAAAIRRRGE